MKLLMKPFGRDGGEECESGGEGGLGGGVGWKAGCGRWGQEDSDAAAEPPSDLRVTTHDLQLTTYYLVL